MSEPDVLIHTLITRCYVGVRSAATHLRTRLEEEHGEGVISVAIAVLIMAFLGLAMWIAFEGLFETAETKTTNQVNKIGG